MAYTMVNLRADAIAEARRLARARAVIRDGDRDVLERLESDATWIAAPRRGRLRRALGCRICLIWRATFENPSGHALESHLVPVLIEVAEIGSPRIHDIEDVVRSRVDEATNGWRAD